MKKQQKSPAKEKKVYDFTKLTSQEVTAFKEQLENIKKSIICISGLKSENCRFSSCIQQYFAKYKAMKQKFETYMAKVKSTYDSYLAVFNYNELMKKFLALPGEFGIKNTPDFSKLKDDEKMQRGTEIELAYKTLTPLVADQKSIFARLSGLISKMQKDVMMLSEEAKKIKLS